MYEHGVEYSTEATIDRRRPAIAAKSLGFGVNSGWRIPLTGCPSQGNLSGMPLEPAFMVPTVLMRLNPLRIL
jgi:hypothetical protein